MATNLAQSNMQNIAPLPMTAGGTIVQARMVIYGSGGTITAASAITDAPVGVSLIAASSGDVIPVQTMGVAQVTASAAVTAGAQVMVTASGSGKVSASSGATAQSIGIALDDAATDGDIIRVLLMLGAKSPPNS